MAGGRVHADHCGALGSSLMSVEWLLFLHLAGAFLFVSGAVAAAALRLAALRRERPAEIALLLRAVRPLVPVLGIGLSMVLVFGIWLADRLGIGLGAGWITATFVLLGWIVGRRRRGRPAGSPHAGARRTARA